MGLINKGILGGFSGKVGPVVGGDWKGIDYMRSYVIPANPRTVPQTTQRDKFAEIQIIASDLLQPLCQTFWNPRAVKMSGYNLFMRQNLLVAGMPAAIYSGGLILSEGNLKNIVLSNLNYASAIGEFGFDFNDGFVGVLPDANDKVACLLLKGNNPDVYYWTDECARRDELGTTITIEPNLAGITLHVYCFVWREEPDGSRFASITAYGSYEIV